VKGEIAMGLLGWWTSMQDGLEAAGELIEEDFSYVSDDTLYELAEKRGVKDPKSFVEAARYELNTYHEDEQVRENGTWFQKFDHGVLVDGEKHPILKLFFG
jgi:hypothetical protein